MTSPAAPVDTPEPDASVAALSFEAALAELETVVRALEAGDVPLDDAVALYARGETLRAHCQQRLAAAQVRIEQISIGPDGRAAGTTPFSAE